LFIGSKNDILNFIGLVSYRPHFAALFAIAFSIIGMIIVGFMNFEKVKKE